MREIKFRAWDKENNCWYYFTFDGCKQFDRTSEKLGDLDSDWYQFTGLKDKNGKEIYEGDICKDTNYTKKIPIGVIKWFDEPLPCFSFQIKKNWCVYDEEVDNWEHLEVIGNIYENKELLK